MSGCGAERRFSIPGAARRSGGAAGCCGTGRGRAGRRGGAAIARPTRPQTVSLLYQSSAVRPTPFVAGRLVRHDFDATCWHAKLLMMPVGASFMLPGGMPFYASRWHVPFTYRWFTGIHDYPRYAITSPTAIFTVGNGVFGVTNGRKWRSRRPDVPWVIAFLVLPTVENRTSGPNAYRGFCRFCHYQR